jgi:hypothetical protein
MSGKWPDRFDDDSDILINEINDNFADLSSIINDNNQVKLYKE